MPEANRYDEKGRGHGGKLDWKDVFHFAVAAPVEALSWQITQTPK